MWVQLPHIRVKPPSTIAKIVNRESKVVREHERIQIEQPGDLISQSEFWGCHSNHEMPQLQLFSVLGASNSVHLGRTQLDMGAVLVRTLAWVTVSSSLFGFSAISGSCFGPHWMSWFMLCSALWLIQDSIIKTRLSLSNAQISLRWLDRYVWGHALHGCGRALCLYSGSGVARLSWRGLTGRFAAKFLVFAICVV